ncbi:MAG: ISAzo13 family transposase, partial [Cytophagales bacterium]|nr:ISAzo13 family transposase [Cytophagales bacterium]
LVNDHDFPSCSDGKVIPHGIYDLRKNEASLHLNTSHDTTEFACESIELWWCEQGRFDYPCADELLILCDGGGSNSSSAYIFKEDLQLLSNRLGLRLRIAHYPPYCSKYNPIEHRVFPHVTRACKGLPLETIETAKYYMEKTETTKGLKVAVRIIDKVFEKGRQYAADFRKNMSIQFDELLPKWNYTAIPKTS